MNLNILKYLTFRRLSDSSSTFFPGEYFFKQIQLDDSTIKNAMRSSNKWLYIHIPFCITECDYCACYKKQIHTSDNIDLYITSLVKELSLYHKQTSSYEKISFDTIVFWWWTPSILSVRQLDRLLSGIYRFIDNTSLMQFSFEAAPYLLSKDKILLLKKYGVTRISLWVQTFDKTVLTLNNRPYLSYSKICDLVNVISTNGIDCVIDLMVWIRGQTFEICKNDIDKAKIMNIQGITINYFYSNKQVKYVDSHRLVAIKKEFSRYIHNNPIHNKSLLMQEDRLYKQPDYSVIWLWVGAISIFCWTQIIQKKSFSNYYKMLSEEKLPFESGIILSHDLLYLKDILFSMRYNKNINLNEFNHKYNIEFSTIFKKEIQFLKDRWILDIKQWHMIFLKNKLVTHIYMSIMFMRLINLDRLLLDYNNSDLWTLDINLISLIDEL